MLLGAEDLLHHAEQTLGIKAGGTTADGLFTLEEVECIAACTEAPALQVNYRYHHQVSEPDFDLLIDDLRSGRRGDIPPHGTLHLVRQHIPPNRAAGVALPEVPVAPAWMRPSGEQRTGTPS
jgi:NADH-quinone oxidoreductase subunit E